VCCFGEYDVVVCFCYRIDIYEWVVCKYDCIGEEVVGIGLGDMFEFGVWLEVVVDFWWWVVVGYDDVGGEIVLVMD